MPCPLLQSRKVESCCSFTGASVPRTGRNPQNARTKKMRRGDSHMHFIDLDLARRVEMAEARAGRECAEACHRLHPEFPVAVEEIAGGIAVFAGVDSPVTQAIGVGLRGAVSD